MCQHKSQETILFYGRIRTKQRSVLAQITINRFQDVLAQITRDNCFQEGQKQKRGVCSTNHNKQILRCVSTNHKRYFFYRMTRRKKRSVLAQTIIEKVQQLSAHHNSTRIYKHRNSNLLVLHNLKQQESLITYEWYQDYIDKL